MNNVLRMLLLGVTIALLAGCAGTQQMRESVKTGFLGKDYAKLKESEEDERALLSYIKPGVDWRSYNKIIIDPVTIWKDEGTKDVKPEDLQRLANELWSKINEEMGKDLEIVHQGGPGVMKVQAAITEAEASNPAMDTVSSVVPQLRLLTGAKGVVAGGKPGFVGAASVEVKVTDARTGQLLGAAVDRRAGTKSIRGSTNEWGDVEQAYSYWAKKMRWRICELREGEGSPTCEEIKPKA